MNPNFTPCTLQAKADPTRRTLFKVERAGMVAAFIVAEDVLDVLDTIRATPELIESAHQILSINQVAGSVYVWA